MKTTIVVLAMLACSLAHAITVIKPQDTTGLAIQTASLDLSTGTPLTAFNAFISTAGPKLDAATVILSTTGPQLRQVAVDTTTLNTVKLSTGVAIPGSLLDLSTYSFTGETSYFAASKTFGSSVTISGAGGLGVTYGVTAATITTTGGLSVAGASTFTAVVNMSTQPFIRAAIDYAQHVPDSAWTSLYWSHVSSSSSIGWTKTSSDTVTALYPGVYLMTCTARLAANATGIRQVAFWSGSNLVSNMAIPGSTANAQMQTTAIERLEIGQTVQCKVYQTSGGNLDTNNSAGAYYITYMSVAKIQ
jgi:hypothetical protein